MEGEWHSEYKVFEDTDENEEMKGDEKHIDVDDELDDEEKEKDALAHFGSVSASLGEGNSCTEYPYGGVTEKVNKTVGSLFATVSSFPDLLPSSHFQETFGREVGWLKM